MASKGQPRHIRQEFGLAPQVASHDARIVFVASGKLHGARRQGAQHVRAADLIEPLVGKHKADPLFAGLVDEGSDALFRRDVVGALINVAIHRKRRASLQRRLQDQGDKEPAKQLAARRIKQRLVRMNEHDLACLDLPPNIYGVAGVLKHIGEGGI